MLIRDKKTGRFLSQKQSDKIIAREKQIYKQKVENEVKKSHTPVTILLCGIIAILAIAFAVK